MALAGVSLAVPALWAQPRLEKSRVSIAVCGKAVFHQLPLTIVEQLGYFKAEGLDIEIIDFPNESAALRAVMSGEADVACGAYEQTIHLQARGYRFQAFMVHGRAPGIAMGISSRVLPGHQSVADLRGRRIGISGVNSLSHTVANLILSGGGIKPDQVSFVEVGTTVGSLSALRSGQVDAMCNAEPVMTILEQKGELHVLADTRSLKGTLDVCGGHLPAVCLHAPLAFVQKNRRTVQAMAYAMAHGLKWLQTAGPSDIVKIVPEAYMLGDRALYLAAFDKAREAISPDGFMPEGGPRNVARVLSLFDQRIQVDKIDLSKTYTNEFASVAKGRFKA